MTSRKHYSSARSHHLTLVVPWRDGGVRRKTGANRHFYNHVQIALDAAAAAAGDFVFTMAAC